MSEDKIYKDGDIVWVRLGNNWWPGEVTGPTRHPDGLINHLKRAPYCVVKFFNENTYEYVRNNKQILPFQCAKQEEFIRKGYSLYNSGNSFMEKFPSDVEVAKQLIRRKESSLLINDRPNSIVKAILGQPLIRTNEECCDGSEYREKRRSSDSITKILNITQNRNNDVLKLKSQVSTNALNLPNDKTKNKTSSPANNGSNYQCNFCDFSSVRLNVMILHRKMHSNRNSMGTNNLVLTKSVNALSEPIVAPVTATKANINVVRNEMQQKQILNKNKKNSKTKVSTISRDATKLPEFEPPSPVKESASLIAPAKSDTISLTLKARNSRTIKLQTPTDTSKIAKKTAIKAKKEETAYDTILSDFCCVEEGASPPSEEQQSRRSMRYCKTNTENSAGKLSTVCIDLSETKAIQKIPKKREYSSLRMQDESSLEVTKSISVEDPDVVCLPDKEKERTSEHSVANKRDAEDIRRMLLADWSDEDETLNDANLVDVSDNSKNNVCISALVDEKHNSSAMVVTSTPVIKSSSSSTGRIRNIPKKDRRDVVLQDFNNDLSFGHTEDSDRDAKTVAVELDSSNSSVVEIIEDQSIAAIITINDDEDPESSRSSRNQADVNGAEAKDIDTAGLINDKTVSGSTSTSTLSCFDFQDDEDDPDNSSITIPHFKKKYLSGDKLQALSTTTTDDLIEDDMDKNRSELAEKDKRLAAEIETLLEQTQPTSTDLLNSNSFEESISVKDLPIKERGKRIFKSRNKIRTGENKTNIDHETIRTGDFSLSIGAQTAEMGQSNLNENTGTESFDNEKDRSKAEVVITMGKEVELLSNEESLKSKKCFDEISSREVFFCPQSDIPKLLDDDQLPQNEDKENRDLMERNKNCLEESISDEKTNENQLETPNTYVENSIENISKGQTEGDDKMNDKIELSQEMSKDKEDTIQKQQPVLARTDQMSKTEGKVDNKVAEDIEVNNETCLVVEPSPSVVQDIVDNSSPASFSAEPSDVRNIEKKDMAASKVKVLEIEILGHGRKNVDSDYGRECEMDTDGVKSPNQLSTTCKDLKTFAPTEICDDNVKNEMLRRSLDKGLFIINPEKNDDSHKKENQNQSSETVFKIRVKSPEELLNHALVTTSQQEQEVPGAVDSNDIRLSVTTPTDENSSMGASDTGAEFGSPTSMLSEERLPTFRFQNSQTPQQEIERCETELKLDNVTKMTNEGINENGNEIDNSDQIGENLKKFKLHIAKDGGHRKCLRQQRFSMDFKCFQTEAKSLKRQRMSVDSITSADENNFKKGQENSLKITQHKNEESTRPKNRHMKITPRRNVSELFKTNAFFENHGVKLLQKSNSVDIVEESLSMDDVVFHTENKPSENDQTIVSIPENSSVVSNEVFEERTEKVQSSESIKNNELQHLNNEEQVILTSEDKKDNVINDKLITHTKAAADKESSNALEAESKISHSPTKEITVDISNNNDNTSNKSIGIQGNSVFHPITSKSTDENVVRNLNCSDNVNTNPHEIPIATVNRDEAVGETILLSVDNRKTHNDHVLEAPYSPVPPPPSPQEREIVVESENVNQAINRQQEIQSDSEVESRVAVIPKEIRNEGLVAKEKKFHLSEEDKKLEIPKRNEPLIEDVVSTLASAVLETVGDTNAINVNVMSETGTLIESSMVPCPLGVMDFGSTTVESNPPKKSGINTKYENELLNPTSPQAKDLIIECEPSTPQGIIECDDNVLAQVTPEKEVIIESGLTNETSAQKKDIIIEENLQLEAKETLLEREFPVIEPKEKSSSVDIIQQLQLNTLETDADKAAEEFLIEFDSIVNHSHTAEEDINNSTIEDAINAEDLINNIIEEVHEDHQLKHNTSTKSKSPVPYEPVATYTVVAHKNSWNQIFKDSLNKQLRSTKRRQTICFEISEKKEGVTERKQALDFESILPMNKTKRTAERKLTLPTTETKLSNTPQSQNIFALNHNQLTLNKKFIPATKRKLSIEDNITPFIIERPKQQHQPCNTTAGPPPLQRIIPVNRQAHIIPKPSLDSLSETTPLQTNDNLFHELFPSESTSNVQPVDTTQRSEYGLVTHQQIISSPTISSISQNKMADAKISANKQIGVDSRGNKYVIIKTPPTDIVVQPTITSSTAAAVAGTSNFGTTITIQPLSSRSTTDLSATSTATINKNLSSAVATSSCKQQVPQQQQVKHISITVQSKPSLEISNSSEMSAKTQSRNRRKAAQAKAIASATAANSNINSAKHRQAMEALTRRLSIASEAPPLAKMPRTSSTRVQTQISNNSNLTTFFADSNIPNIAQQQLIQLQQQHTQTTSNSLPPPIILNKNAHQQSLMHRKPRRIPQHVQQQHQTQIQRQQQLTTTKLQQLQQQQQQQQQQSQPVHQQQHVITQIALQQQSQQHNSLQPPPLQQIQTPSLQTQQQIVQQADGIIITTPVTDDDNVIDSNTQLIALPTQPYPGYSETFLLCKVKGNTCKPVDNVPLYLNKQLNELVPVPLEAIEGGHKSLEQQIEIKASNAHEQQLLESQKNEQNERQQDNDSNLQIANINCNLLEGEMTTRMETEHQMQQQQIMEECVEESCVNGSSNQMNEFTTNQEVNTELVSNNGILLNIEGQQVLLDATTFAHLLANPDANTQLISDDGTEYVLTHEVLQALQMQQEQQQVLELTNVAPEQQHHTLEQPRGTDIIAVALAGSDLYDSDVLTIDTSQGVQLIGGDGTIVFPSQTGAITQQHLTPPAVVTNAVLDQSPIMSTLEVPSSIATAHKLQGSQIITVPSHQLATSSNAALGMGGRSNLEDSLAAIGVTTQTSSIHSSLGLPITVTNPNIASKVTSAGPLNEMLQFVSHRPPTAAAAANAVAAAALAGESRIFTD